MDASRMGAVCGQFHLGLQLQGIQNQRNTGGQKQMHSAFALMGLKSAQESFCMQNVRARFPRRMAWRNRAFPELRRAQALCIAYDGKTSYRATGICPRRHIGRTHSGAAIDRNQRWKAYACRTCTEEASHKGRIRAARSSRNDSTAGETGWIYVLA